jgi:GNAT superfamily N-acetyltransferase
LGTHAKEKSDWKWTPRLAVEGDVPRIGRLIEVSARELQAGDYSAAQIEAALGPVFAVDRQLILDGTYYVVEKGEDLAGCGGWSRRRSMYGGDAGRVGPEPELDPSKEAARIRAFFTNPSYTRMGVARAILEACERTIRAAGFSSVTLAATLTGEPFYRAFGYVSEERRKIELLGAESMGTVLMGKKLF